MQLGKVLVRLEQLYEGHVVPGMDYLKQQEELLGDRWPDGIFLPPVMVDEATRDKILQAGRTLGVFWDHVRDAYNEEVLTDANFFDCGKRWVNLGRVYRELVEPVDIVNYYYCNKHTEGRHYADGICNEAADNNHTRPERYLLLQSQELRRLGSATSSLGKAHQLKDLLGNAPWQNA